jgi:16S rRNA (uracil1498-N3)-methyltransferase
MEQYFQPNLPESGSIQLGADEERHLLKVRRARVGDRFRCTDGKGKIAQVVIGAGKSSPGLYTIESVAEVSPALPDVHLAVAMPRQDARVEWMLEKAVELGARQITPLLTERGIHDRIRRERLEKIMISALKQSLSAYLPVLNEPCTLPGFLSLRHNQILLAHCYDSPKSPIGQLALMPEVTLMIGPEGDFSENEVAHINKLPACNVTLGSLRLRTETAVLVALAHIRQNQMCADSKK